MAKRVFDVACAVVLAIILSPLFVMIVCRIRLGSPGPIIFRSRRVGYRGVPFIMFKFRTMQDGSGRHHDLVLRGDPRVTLEGRFLRATHLDELPQLWNVIKGEMSLVGPRPMPPEIVELRGIEMRRYHQRHGVVPGITGVAQLYGREELIRRGHRRALVFDIYYLKNRCMLLDLKILFRTLGAVILRQGM